VITAEFDALTIDPAIFDLLLKRPAFSSTGDEVPVFFNAFAKTIKWDG
jgi:hypothetical protein